MLDFDTVLSDEVPAVLWNIKGDALRVTPVSALGKDDYIYENTLKEILEKDAKILVFATNRLSLEDFSSSDKPLASNDTLQNLQSFLDGQRYMFMSHVNDPLSQIHEVHCGVQEIVVDQSIDENVLQSVSMAFDKSCVVILHITDAGIVGPREKAFQPEFQKTLKNIIGIFTGLKSSWGGVNEEHHKFRNLLSLEESSEQNYVNFSSCIIMYAENGTLRIDAANTTISLPSNIDTNGSECGNNTALLKLKFGPAGEYSNVVLVFNFTSQMGSWTTQSYLELSEAQINLNSKDLAAPNEFSYSCGDFVLKSNNISDLYIVKFSRFQIQPFQVKEKFNESFDCITWFTVPIWMGVFVALILIVIINVGVYSLFSIRTMDRFDDPKGKTISVAPGTD
ncbi:uncharacterized protein NPIL_604721 [Nephila pilipes]|uniref:V-type proton ATPase subunit S1 n=1 Tax=Nephila pilipes TaxID=299642 RepID=A0A8X6I7P1_NEPPI|nr:uncharacterized protein NPIL_604721 [Nephila pilipes]